ncbi:multidrug effflux MFS transporter [Roseicyclus sp. F158]|uniref:Bcr/CflA family efflux transporter n=1 Tax=Tropicimonas omnivorans TaxID=3075590 RepID=A0ABU3DEM5_9RHOB|nr:multidrug effflux MFS transporter [Roseicyclus sp. F158]MDT0682127.1 multidrug effflux MFS transporter [Roseicyclus sp. F158]
MAGSPSVRFLDRTTPPHIVTLVALASISALSMNVFLPSLPSMTEHFGTPYAVMQLTVTAYLGINAVLQILIGPISDRFGRRPVLLGAMAIFLLATLGTLFAASAGGFLFWRMMQAAVVTGLVLSRAVVRDIYPPDRSASMIGYVTMGMALVPMISPMIGGVLDEVFGWKANFWLLFVCGAGVAALIHLDLGETATDTAATFSAQFREYPELVTSRRFWGYCLTAMLASGAFFSFLGGAPYVATEVFDLSPSQMGGFFGFPAVGYALGNFLTGRYSSRVGIDRMAILGCVVCAAGLASLALWMATGPVSPVVYFGSFIWVGIGNGLVLPNVTSGMLSVRPRLAGTASGLGGACMIGGGAVLSAIAGAALTPSAGHWILAGLMQACSALALLVILWVASINRREAAAGQRP